MRIIKRSTIFSVPENTSKLGIKLFLLPFFVAAVIFSFGFTHQRNERNDKQSLFDSSLSLLMERNQLEQQFELPFYKVPASPPDNSPVSGRYFSIPDTTVKKDSVRTPDSLVVKLSKSDSIKLLARQDSLRIVDSLSQDSTARLQQFRYVRPDQYTTRFRERKESSLLLRPSQGTITRIAQLDPTGTKVIIKEEIGGNVLRPILELPLEEYIELRLEAINRKL